MTTEHEPDPKSREAFVMHIAMALNFYSVVRRDRYEGNDFWTNADAEGGSATANITIDGKPYHLHLETGWVEND